MQIILAIASGGAAGALLRHYLNSAITHILPGSSFPWGIFVINVIGSFLMGILISLFAHFWEPPQAIKAFLTVGMLGAFTTFSTFSLDTVLLIERGAWVSAAIYTGGSVILAIISLYGGMIAIRSIAG